MSESQFYYERGGQSVGPVTFAQLKSLADAGKLKQGTLVWREGMADWSPARTVPDLFAPPPQPLAQPSGGAPPLPAGEMASAGPQGVPGSSEAWRQDAIVKAKHGWSDALDAAKILYADPLGGLAKIYESLGHDRAMMVGGIFAAVFLLCGLLGNLIAGPKMADFISGSVDGRIVVEGRFAATARGVMIGLAADIAFAAALVGISALCRQRVRSRTTLAADVLVVGAALVPVGLGEMLAHLFAGDNLFLGLLVALCRALAYGLATMLLFGGLTRLIEVPERPAVLAAPGMLAVAACASIIIHWIF